MPEPVALVAYGFDFGIRFGFDAEDKASWPQWFRDADNNPECDLAEFAYDGLLTAYGMCDPEDPIPDGSQERADAISATGVQIVAYGALLPTLTGYIIAAVAYVTDWNKVHVLTSLDPPADALPHIRDACRMLGIPVPDGEPSWLLAASEHL